MKWLLLLQMALHVMPKPLQVMHPRNIKRVEKTAVYATCGENLDSNNFLNSPEYKNLCYTCSMILTGKCGYLEKVDIPGSNYYQDDFNYHARGYVDNVIKVTKNYAGPKIEVLNDAGVWRIDANPETPLAKLAIDVLGVQAGSHVAPTGLGYEASAHLVKGSASMVDFQVGAGVSSNIGIVDDSVSVKLLGIGFNLGRKNGICIFDNCIGIDLGALFG